MNVNIKGHMTKNLISIAQDRTIEEALMIMKSRHFRHLPVVDETNKIVGIVSDRDLYRGLSSEDRFVANVMVKNLLKVDIKTNIQDVVKNMIKLKASSFLITEDDVICGLITTEDMLYLLYDLLEKDEIAPTLLEQFVHSFQKISDQVSAQIPIA